MEILKPLVSETEPWWSEASARDPGVARRDLLSGEGRMCPVRLLPHGLGRPGKRSAWLRNTGHRRRPGEDTRGGAQWRGTKFAGR